MLYTKHIVDTVPMTSWGRSFYNNFLSMFPWAIIAIAKESDIVSEFCILFNFLSLFFFSYHRSKDMTKSDTEGKFTGIVLTVVSMSCLVGIGISVSVMSTTLFISIILHLFFFSSSFFVLI